ncbi:unnamed protein product, partial [Effrenium voratum]
MPTELTSSGRGWRSPPGGGGGYGVSSAKGLNGRPAQAPGNRGKAVKERDIRSLDLPRVSENIRVCVRIRPLTSEEANSGELPSIVPGPQGSGLLKLLLLDSLSTSRRTDERKLVAPRSWPKAWEFDFVISGKGSQAR